MGSNTVAKTVAKHLKFYIDVKRLEDGFDLSSRKASSQAPFTARPTLQYEGLHDRALKHYFSQPEVRAQLTRLEPAESDVCSPRERHIRESLTSTMKKYQFGKSQIPEWYFVYTLGGPRHQFPVDYKAAPGKPRKTKVVKGGWPVLRNVPSPDVPPDEAERLVNNATKILVNAEAIEHKYKGQQRTKSAFQRNPVKPAEKPGAEGKPRPLTAKYASDSNGHRVPSAKVKAYDDGHLDKAPRTYLRRPQSSPRSDRRKTAKSSGESAPPPHHAPLSPRPTSQPQERPQRQWCGRVVTVPAGQSEEEAVSQVTEGPAAEYHVTVKTANCIGASTTAAVHMTIYGEKGRTPALHLATSQHNKVKFQRGKEDLFVLKTPHVGQINKIKIGHDRPELSYAWCLESLTVVDRGERQAYRFPCNRWLSGQDEDRQTHCTFVVDPHSDAGKTETGPPSEVKASSRGASTKPRPTPHSRDTGPRRPQTTSGRPSGPSVAGHGAPSARAMSKGREGRGQAGTRPETQGKGKSCRPLVSGQEERGRDHRPQPVDQEFLAGYRAGLEAIEASERQKREEERMKNHQVLRGPSIHEACRKGDLERVRVLLQAFPEMKDATDENGWTPLHLAASSGEVDLLKHLTSSGDDNLDVETPTGYTPTHLAAMNGHSAAVKIMNAMGASMDCTTVDKQTPLHLASSVGHLECVKCLVANGADLWAEDSYSRTPLDLAEEYEQDAVTHFLRRCQQDLANPSSTFAQMHHSQNKGAPQAAAQGKTKHGDKDTRQSEGAQGARPLTSSQRKKEKEKKELEEKRELYEEQHRHMEEEGVSFLDLIRQEMGD